MFNCKTDEEDVIFGIKKPRFGKKLPNRSKNTYDEKKLSCKGSKISV
jgi:hypothetical protein